MWYPYCVYGVCRCIGRACREKDKALPIRGRKSAWRGPWSWEGSDCSPKSMHLSGGEADHRWTPRCISSARRGVNGRPWSSHAWKSRRRSKACEGTASAHCANWIMWKKERNFILLKLFCYFFLELWLWACTGEDQGFNFGSVVGVVRACWYGYRLPVSAWVMDV